MGATGFDKESAVDRATLGVEAGFAPELVKMSGKLTESIKNPTIRSGATKLLNLGMSPAMAMRVARFASPIGIASLIAEGTILSGKAISDESKRIDEIENPELQEIETENFIKSIRGYAGGGRVKDEE